MKEDIQKDKRTITDINNLFIIIFASLLIFTFFTSNVKDYSNKFKAESLEIYLSVTNLVISLNMMFFLSHKQKLIYEIKN